MLEQEKYQIYVKIQDLKLELSKYKEDVEQVELFGMERTDYEYKKQKCKEIINELRELTKSLEEVDGDKN